MRIIKALGVAIGGILLLCAPLIFNSGTCFEGGESYTFFCGHDSSDCRVVKTYGNAVLAKLTLADVCGESTEYERLDVQAFLDEVNGRAVFTEKLSDSLNYYCTADLPYSVELYGTEINLHICIKQGGVTVASPIIFGGY